MVTVVNTPNAAPTERTTTIERTTDSGAGWAVAVIVLLAVLIGGYLWFRYYQPPATPESNGSTNINVTLPSTGNNPSTGGTNNSSDNSSLAPTQ